MRYSRSDVYEYDIELIDATKVKRHALASYDAVGFASGIYYSKFHQAVLDFASLNLPVGKDIYLIYTYGSSRKYTDGFMKTLPAEKNIKLIGSYGCMGYDTYGPFKLLGGIAKGHPTERDIQGAVDFMKKILNK